MLVTCMLQLDLRKEYLQIPARPTALPMKATTSGSYLIGNFSYRNACLNSIRKLAFAEVLIFDAANSNNPIDATQTDINGTFGPIDIPSDVTSIFCRVSTVNDLRVTVFRGNSGIEYLQDMSHKDIVSGENRFDYTFFEEEHNWFTVFSYDTGLNRGWYYILNTTGNNTTGAKAHYPCSGIVPYYLNTTREIYLPEGTYLYTDSILHEYAHYVMHYLYGLNYWPPNATGPYYVEKATNATQAWVEGWAYYFPMAVDNNGTYDGSNLNLWDFEDQTWNSTGWDDNDTVICRVAGAFLDIYDDYNDTELWSYENMTGDGFGRIWNTVSEACYCYCDQFRMFWVIWNGTYYILDPDTHQKSSSSPYNGQDWKNTLMTMFQSSIDYRAPGDVIVDGKVDAKDVCYVAVVHFGEQEGIDPNWNYLADLVHDGKINAKDVTLVTSNYGKKYDC